MFTINIYLRFALIALGLLLGIGLWAAYGFWYGFPFLLIGVVMLVGYILFGTVMSSLLMIQSGNLEGAEKRLALTLFPQWLLFMVKSQYFMAKSTLAMQQQDYDTAEKLTKKSLEIGFSSDNEKAIALFQLAGIAANRQKINVAQNYINEIKKLNITEKMISEQLKEFEKNLKLMTQAKGTGIPMMMGRPGFRPGGKRPSPKIR